MLNYDCFSFLLCILDLRETDNELDARITDLEDGTGQGKESGFKIFILEVIFLVRIIFNHPQTRLRAGHVCTGVCQSVHGVGGYLWSNVLPGVGISRGWVCPWG